MADLIDVQNVLVSTIAQAVYPSGVGSPSASVPCIIYPGWPSSTTLDADLKAGKCHVSVFPRQDERKTTRYSTELQTTAQNLHTLTATVVNQTITIAGTVSVPQNVALIVNGKAYVYPVQITDTLAAIATGLAALVVADISGTSSVGAVLTIGTTGRIQAARIATAGTVAAEYRRQERVFQITIWANTPANRDTLSSIIDIALAPLLFLTMPDGFAARITYKNSYVTDGQQKAGLYRRDLNYSVEYATTASSTAYEIAIETLNVTGGVATPAPTKTINF